MTTNFREEEYTKSRVENKDLKIDLYCSYQFEMILIPVYIERYI